MPLKLQRQPTTLGNDGRPAPSRSTLLPTASSCRAQHAVHHALHEKHNAVHSVVHVVHHAVHSSTCETPCGTQCSIYVVHHVVHRAVHMKHHAVHNAVNVKQTPFSHAEYKGTNLQYIMQYKWYIMQSHKCSTGGAPGRRCTGGT